MSWLRWRADPPAATFRSRVEPRVVGFSVRRSLALAVLALLALFTLMSARALLEARAELAIAQRALAAGLLPQALSHYRLAARWDAPGNVYARTALETMEQLARTAEQRGDGAFALSAYRAVHGALHAARGIDVSDPELLARADARIAELMARDASGEHDERLSPQQRVQHYRRSLRVNTPHPRGVFLACGGFFTWVTAFAMLVLRGLDDEGRIVRRVARPSFLLLVFGWVAFAVGLQIA